MPKLGYGYALYPGSPSSVPSDISGLGLWLKADAGVNTTPETFISQITLSGAGTEIANGVYTRTGGGTTQFTGSNPDIIIYYVNNVWLVYNQNLALDYYQNTSLNFESNWEVLSGNPDAPSASYVYSKTGNLSVVSWKDQSGNGNDVAVPAIIGTSPIFELSQINGKPSIYSDGSGAIGLGTDQINLNEFTVFVVSKPFANTARRAFSNIGYNDGNVLLGTWEDGGGNVYTRTCYGGLNWVYQDLVTQQFVWHLDVMTNSTITNLSSYWQDGVNYAQNILGAAGILDGVSIGADEYYYAGVGAGKIQYAEFVLYNRVLTTSERQQVEGYLNFKYAIY